MALSNTEKGVQNTLQKEYFKQNFQLFRKCKHLTISIV